MKCFVLLLCLVPIFAHGAAVYDAKENMIENEARSESVLPESKSLWKVVDKVMHDCNSDDYTKMGSCLGIKAITAVDRASRMQSINIVPGVTLVNEDSERNSRSLVTEEDVQNQLEKEPANEKSARVLDMLFDSAAKFFQTHTLQFNLPLASEEVSRALEEGRGGKLKKKFTPILLLLGAKIFAVLPIIIGIVGLMAFKALFIGKIAILLAGFLALQKFTSGGGLGKLSSDSYLGGAQPGHSSWSAPTASSSGGGYYRRSYQNAVDPQNFAYSAQVPNTSS